MCVHVFVCVFYSVDSRRVGDWLDGGEREGRGWSGYLVGLARGLGDYIRF